MLFNHGPQRIRCNPVTPVLRDLVWDLRPLLDVTWASLKAIGLRSLLAKNRVQFCSVSSVSCGGRFTAASTLECSEESDLQHSWPRVTNSWASDDANSSGQDLLTNLCDDAGRTLLWILTPYTALQCVYMFSLSAASLTKGSSTWSLKVQSCTSQNYGYTDTEKVPTHRIASSCY